MKIFFISQKPFGLMGTPGTYLLVEAYAQWADICVIANKDHTDSFRIVHKPSNSVKLHEVSFNREDYLAAILQIVNSFEPDIVNVASQPDWTSIVNYLKENHPFPKYVFDIKSPLLAPANSKRAAILREQGRKSLINVDLVLTRSPEDVKTWILHCSKPVLIYPLGVRLADYSPRNPGDGFSGCTRFVYVGAIAPRRQLETMLEYIAALPQDIREICTFDFFGSGPSEKDLVNTIRKLGLEKTAAFKGCVDTVSLPGLLAGYDAGIAWVPHELYDASPSLKIVEYTAAGLLPIAMDTTAHRRFAERGFHVSFFSDSPVSFASAIEQACTKGFSRNDRTGNLTTIQDYDWIRIVEKYILPAFYKLLEQPVLKKNGGRTNYDTNHFELPVAHSPTSQNNTNTIPVNGSAEPSPHHIFNNLSRILVISPRPFGLLGTAGTYLLADSYAKKVDTCVVARKPILENANIVYKPNDVNIIHELDFSQSEFLSDLHNIVNQFQPQVVIVFNYVGWFRIVSYLKQNFPQLKCVLDIQTPLIIENDEPTYKRIRRKGRKYAHQLDMIIALSLEAIPTWIPSWKGRSLRYSLGVKIINFNPQDMPGQTIYCRRFVFIGALHKLRKLDVLIAYISSLPEQLKQNLKFDFYGDGPAREELENLVNKNGLQDCVSFRGVVESEKLSTVLSEYDAGIAWVPHEIYNYNPSLKLLEYIAAGIVPVAMDTIAHKRDAERGLHIEFFSDSAASFGATVRKVFERGFPVSKRNDNLKLITRHDFDVISEKEILPALSQLVRKSRDPIHPVSVGDNSISQKISGNKRLQNFTKQSSNISDKACQWKLPLRVPKPQRLTQSKIRIAGILGERLFKSIALECDLLFLTPGTWESVLSYARPDYLLIESVWSTAGGHWHMAQGDAGAAHHELIEIIKKANKLGVPTILWMTLDSSFHEFFFEFSQHFDYVFCADPREVELLRKDGISSRTLLPAVQPVLFNPVQDTKNDEAFDAGVLFDGWIDLVRYPEIGATLKQLTAINLNIFQSTQMMYKKDMQGIDSTLLPFVKGSVDALMLPALIKHASMYISMDKSAASRTQKIWSALEAAACRLPIAHLGMIEPDDLRYTIVQQFDDESLFCDYISGNDSFKPTLEQDRQKAWRETYLNHTIDKRLQTICREIGIENDWEKFPKSSCLIADQFEIDINSEKVSSANNRIIVPKGRPIKKVLFIGPWKFAPNVGKKNVRIIYPSLFEPLHDCEFHILHGKPELPEYTKELVERYGVVFHRIEGRKIRKWIAKTTSLTKELDIDVLTNVFFGYRHGYVAAKVAQNTRRKSVVRFAANEIFVRKCSGAFRGLRGKARYLKEKIMEIRAIRMANEVIAMSPWEVKRIKNLTLSPDKVKWCMRGIDVNGYAPPQERKYRVARNFLFVGRKRKEKGYRLIETVAKNLFPKYPDIRFYFAGDFEPGKEENRSYLGYCSHEQLKNLYIELDALILPSESEGFANVIVEAMSMGMPCIISKSYHEEYFKHKENALLTELTATDLEKNIIELYNDKNLNTHLSINSRALAVKEFDSKKWAKQYRKIIIG